MEIIKGPLGDVASSENDLVAQITWEADRAIEVKRSDLNREEEAWRAYFPIDMGQWEEIAKAVMIEEGRHCAQFDVVGPKLDALAGALISELPDLSWSPAEGDRSEATEGIADTYYVDKELYNYDWTFLQVARDSLVHAGDMQIVTNRKYGSERVAFERVLPGHLVYDPYWKTDDDRDCEVAYKFAWMTAAQIVLLYDSKADQVLSAVRNLKKQRNPETQMEEKRRRYENRVGDEFKIVEKHWLEHVNAVRLLGRREGEQQWIPFPVSKDQDFLNAFGEMNGIDWTTVLEDTYEDRIHHIAACVPDLSNSLLLGSGKSKVQTNGLPFYHLTPRRRNGRDMGIVEDMLDIQRTINKRESLVTELIAKANGGSTLVDKNIFQDEKQFQEWVKKKNRPGHAELVDLSNTKTPYVHMAANQYPAVVVDQLTRLYDKVLPLVSRASDALSSITSSEDNGVLFERKFQLNMVANTLINKTIRQFINNVGEGYFYQWQITYADREMKVKRRDGKGQRIINQRIGDKVANSATSVPRCRTLVTENVKSPTYQMRWRAVWSEMLQRIDPNKAPAHYQTVINQFFKTVELSEDEREKTDMLGELMAMKSRLMIVKDITGLVAGMKQDRASAMQLDMQIQQLMGQMNQMGMQAEQQQGGPVVAQDAEWQPEMPDQNQTESNGMQPNMISGPDAVPVGAQTPPQLAEAPAAG